MNGVAQRCRLAARRWHFQHGPIDCILEADGEQAAVDRAIEAAWSRFTGVLAELVAELPRLRADLTSAAGAQIHPDGVIARRMVAACRPHAEAGHFVTAMAAVAGSVAEELIGCFDDPRIARASVNNGGDIALRLGPGASYDVGIVADPTDAAALVGPLAVRFRVAADSPVRGVATSGWRGRSFSFGIADSVTVLAASASAADALATIIANAVDVDDPRIVRVAADRLRDDTDLGARAVTRAVPALSAAALDRALARGVAEAERQIAAGRACAVVLCLQGRVRTCVASDRFATLADADEILSSSVPTRRPHASTPARVLQGHRPPAPAGAPLSLHRLPGV